MAEQDPRSALEDVMAGTVDAVLTLCMIVEATTGADRSFMADAFRQAALAGLTSQKGELGRGMLDLVAGKLAAGSASNARLPKPN